MYLTVDWKLKQEFGKIICKLFIRESEVVSSKCEKVQLSGSVERLQADSVFRVKLRFVERNHFAVLARAVVPEVGRFFGHHH